MNNWNSNTPLPKRLKGKCPAVTIGVSCAGRNCRFIKKSCIYSVLKSDLMTGRKVIRELRAEGYEGL